MFIVKLGGSVITDKNKENSFRKKNVQRLVNEIKKSNKKIILVHGAGSFGHITAEKYQLNQGYKRKNQLRGLSLTHTNVRKLNLMVINNLQDAGIPAVSVPPFMIMKLNEHGIVSFDFEVFDNLLKLGFMPVTFGDVVLDQKLGFSICSGDLIVEALACHYKPERTVFVIDEDGLFSSNPKVDKNARLLKHITIEGLNELKTTIDTHSDVTGGMKGKINAIKNISNQGLSTILLNGNKVGRLYCALIDEDITGTFVSGDKK